MISKKCGYCQTDKPINDFSRDNRARDGLQSKCKDCCQMYRQENREKIKNSNKEYRERNSNNYNIYRKNLIQNNVNFRLACNLRTRLWEALKTDKKAGSAVTDLGCTIDELKYYIENKFQPGMNWHNWARKGWHIDHIIPLSKFDLTDREQLLTAVRFTNLQPLWWDENIRKSNK